MRKQKSSLLKRDLQKFIDNKMATIGLLIVLILLVLIVFAPLFASNDPNLVDTSNRNQPPSSEHPLGTDRIGRDLWARLLFGGRMSLIVALSGIVSAHLIGVTLGCMAGYFGGKFDGIIVFISEIFMAFPSGILIFILVGFLGQGVGNLIFVFAITNWTGILRIVRGRILSLKEEAFVEHCKICGVSSYAIMFRHLLPNTMGPVIVSMTLGTGGLVLAEAGLSFIGLGVPGGIATWGNMINAANSLQAIQEQPILWVSPAIMISLFVLGINFLGDGLRDVFDTTM